MRDFESLKFNFGSFKFLKFLPFNFGWIKLSSSFIFIFGNLNLFLLTFSSFYSVFIFIILCLVVMSLLNKIKFFLMNQSNSHSKVATSQNVYMFKVSFESSSSLKTPNPWIRFFSSCDPVKFYSFLKILLHFINATLIPRINFWKNHVSKYSFTEVSILFCPRNV